MTPDSPQLRVMAAGFHPTIQDLGRIGVQYLGIPTSGALDPLALRLANALVGNPPGEAALEIRLLGPTLEVLADSVRVALVGTATGLEILGEGARKVAAGRSVTVRRGQQVRVGAVRDTACCYLAVGGGFAIPAPFGSKSTYVRSGIGGLDGRPLRDEDRLPLAEAATAPGPERALPAIDALYPDGAIRVVFGPQADWFTPGARERLLTGSYEVTTQADRMGLRLDGPELDHARGYNITSDGIATGAIQVPGTRKPIILLADHQTTGGYPKVATVISADLPRVGRLRPGARLNFREVAVEQAEEARKAQEAEMTRILGQVREVREARNLNVSALQRENLISGVVSVAAATRFDGE